MCELATATKLPASMSNSSRAGQRALRASLLLALVSTACGAVYPELATPVRTPPGHVTLDPPPPSDLLFIKFAGANIPERTRDGRRWDSIGGSRPDPFARLSIDDEVILETPVQGDTLTPTWPNQRSANYRIPTGAAAKVELWDSNPINNHPICIKEIRDLPNEAIGEAEVELDCDSGALIRLVIDPAHGKLGLGLFYELRREDIFVTRVLQESPASRAGLHRGAQLLKIQGKEVKAMQEGEAQSLINANAATGVSFSVKRPDGSLQDLTLKEGAVYPLVDEGIPVDG